jgi:hypothetical protein
MNSRRLRAHLLAMKLTDIRVVKWACATLAGHLTILGSMWSIVEFVVLDYPSVRSGTFSAHWALHNATGAVASGAVFAMLFWFLVTRPLLRRVQGSKRLACGNAAGNC